MLFAALVEVCAGRFGTKEKIWAMTILGKEIKKIFGECATTGGGSTRSISVAGNSKMDDFATI